MGDGSATRDFIYVKDVALAIVTAMESKLPEFDAFNVCTGKITTIGDLAKTVVGQFTSISEIKNYPGRDGDILRSECNPEKAKTKLGFTAVYSLDQGIQGTRDWFTSDFI